ncbi:YbbR domain-containing protein [Natronobacillus azotifigens]|uniref:CdaR family protein n=1 Tax=Natronobacillus azotifigens TaxID=472978 RepID=A0A9J6RED2_9BACI|nr:CdaR family protein [Natronobacillus azotifigens]MCZ0703821.1 CdaR family protein [Natronobacillus azotifigens]
MNDWLNKPWVIRGISLVLAILTFALITFDNQESRTADVGFDSFFSSSQETETLEDIPVNIQIDEDSYVVSGVPETVSVTLQGTVSVVQSTATQRNFDVFVDLEGLEPGSHRVPLEYEGISNRLSVYIEPSEIDVVIEERATAEYEVLVDYTNETRLELGYELIDATVSPTTVEITSSRSMIDRIAIVKAFVDVDGIGESMEIRDVPVRVYDSEGNQLNVRVTPQTVDVGVNVANPSKTVPVTIETTGELPDDLRLLSMDLETEEVEIFASEADLDEITEIRTEPINLSEINEDSTIEIGLDLPDAVRLVSEEVITVNVSVEELTDQSFEELPISIENLGGDLTYTFINPEDGELTVTITGYPSDLAEIGASDFQLSVDLAELEDGEHQVPVEVSGPNNIEYTLEMDNVIVQIE